MGVADWANTIYGYFFVTIAILAGLGIAARHAIHRLIEEHLEEMRKELKPINDLINDVDIRASRIEYALYNDGHTGLINKVDTLIENQQTIKIDVEVMKARINE